MKFFLALFLTNAAVLLLTNWSEKEIKRLKHRVSELEARHWRVMEK